MLGRDCQEESWGLKSAKRTVTPRGLCSVSVQLGAEQNSSRSLREGPGSQLVYHRVWGLENTPGCQGSIYISCPFSCQTIAPPCFSLTPNLDSVLLSFIVSSLTLRMRPIPLTVSCVFAYNSQHLPSTEIKIEIEKRSLLNYTNGSPECTYSYKC